MSAPRAIVVVPARDEAGRIASCLQALARQGRASGVRPWVVLVDDRSGDGTRAVAERVLRASGLRHEVLEGPGAGVGWARRVGMDRAALWATRSRAAGDCLLASTDADTLVDDGWLEALLAHVAAGAAVVAGDVLLRDDEPFAPGLRDRRRTAAALRLAAVREREGAGAAHHHFAAASLGLTLDAYEAVGGMPVVSSLEDEALLSRVRAAGLPLVRATDAVVRTSPRPDGRAPRGLAVDVAVETWRASRRHRAEEYPVQRLAALVGETRVSVVLPARCVAGTIGGVLDATVAPLVAAGIVHEVLVVDSASGDGTAAVAAAHGATVLQEDEIRADVGPCRGKGDAMWRALHVATGDVVAFLDADTADPRPAHLAGILGPLLEDPAVAMARGTFDRPRRGSGGEVEPHGGGRVTELTARPLINLHAPLLAGFHQPLAGEFAARAALLRSLPFPTGYGVEIATLMDALSAVGLQGLAECDLGARTNRHQPLRDLTRMAYAVLCAVERRLERGAAVPGAMRLPWEDGAMRAVPVDERDPVDAAAAGARSPEIGPDDADPADDGPADDDPPGSGPDPGGCRSVDVALAAGDA